MITFDLLQLGFLLELKIRQVNRLLLKLRRCRIVCHVARVILCERAPTTAVTIEGLRGGGGGSLWSLHYTGRADALVAQMARLEITRFKLRRCRHVL